MDEKRLWKDEEVLIDYTNWRGERAMRRVRPLTIRFEATEWHEEVQWLMRAVDLERGSTRDFAIKDIHSWAPATANVMAKDTGG